MAAIQYSREYETIQRWVINIDSLLYKFLLINFLTFVSIFLCSSYIFKKNDRIIGFFENFENYLDEDTMWQISESIKPRGSRK